MNRAGVSGRVAVIGSHGAVGTQLVTLLRQDGYVVTCGNRTRRASDEVTEILDARKPAAIRDFALGHDAVVNCAGPSCLLGDSIAAALPPGIPYVDPFGAHAFDGHPAERVCVVNVGCTPGLSGMLTRHLAGRLDECETATICCGGREQGGVAGLADVILSTRNGYGHPRRMITRGNIVAHEPSPWESEDTDAFSADADGVCTAFVTDELCRVARINQIHRFDGFLAIPDRDSLHLLLKAMTHGDASDPDKLLELFAEIDAAKTRLDAGKVRHFVLQATVRGRSAGHPARFSSTVRASDSSILTALALLQATRQVLEAGHAPGVYWGHEFLDAPAVLATLASHDVVVEDRSMTPAVITSGWNTDDDSGFL